QGGPLDEPGALALFLEAAETNPWAARDAAKLLAGGKQLAHDLAAAARWHQRAAEGGVAWSARDLARLFESGKGVDKSIEQAVAWYASALSNANGDTELEALVSKRLSELPPNARVKGAQYLLKEAGYAISVVDGQLGPETKAAIDRFVVDSQLTPSHPEITPNLLAHMAKKAVDKSS
ncbi:MAG: hypothetical protein AAFO01_15175, partial [Pseudomonadota bacterium]